MDIKEKKCTGCKTEEMELEHSLEWEMMKELSRTIKRQYIIIITILAFWLTTIFGFVWHNYISKEATINTASGGDTNYIGNDGDIYNGYDYSSEVLES